MNRKVNKPRDYSVYRGRAQDFVYNGGRTFRDQAQARRSRSTCKEVHERQASLARSLARAGRTYEDYLREAREIESEQAANFSGSNIVTSASPQGADGATEGSEGGSRGRGGDRGWHAAN